MRCWSTDCCGLETGGDAEDASFGVLPSFPLLGHFQLFNHSFDAAVYAITFTVRYQNIIRAPALPFGLLVSTMFWRRQTACETKRSGVQTYLVVWSTLEQPLCSSKDRDAYSYIVAALVPQNVTNDQELISNHLRLLASRTARQQFTDMRHPRAPWPPIVPLKLTKCG